MTEFPQIITDEDGRDFVKIADDGSAAVYESNDIHQFKAVLSFDDEGLTGMSSAWRQDSDDDGIRYFTTEGKEVE